MKTSLGFCFIFLLLKFSLSYNLEVKQSTYKAINVDYILLGHWNTKTSYNQKPSSDQQNPGASHSGNDTQPLLILCQVLLWDLNIKITY